MKYVIADTEKILFVDENKTRLIATLDFLPYTEDDILECQDDAVVKGWDGEWYFAGKVPPKPLDLIQKEYVDAIQNYMDKTVQTRGYDNVFTCISYLNDPNETYAKEAAAVFVWRSGVWEKGHEILNKVLSGEMDIPSVEKVIAVLPELEW